MVGSLLARRLGTSAKLCCAETLLRLLQLRNDFPMIFMAWSVSGGFLESFGFVWRGAGGAQLE